MKKDELADRLAARAGISPAAAADQLDLAVTRILDRIRHGQTTRLPGLGTFRPGPNPRFDFQKPPRRAR